MYAQLPHGRGLYWGEFEAVITSVIPRSLTVAAGVEHGDFKVTCEWRLEDLHSLNSRCARFASPRNVLPIILRFLFQVLMVYFQV